MKSNVYSLILALVFALFAGAANAEEAAKAAGEPETLRARVDAYWTARVARDEKVWDYYTEEGRSDAAEFGNITYQEYSIEGVEIEGNEATVVVKAKVDIPLPPQMRRGDQLERLTRPTLREVWDRAEDGTWYKRATGRSLARFQKNLRTSTKAAGGIGGKESTATAEGNAEAAPGAPAPAPRADAPAAAEVSD